MGYRWAPRPNRKQTPPEPRFWAKVEKGDEKGDCWLWTGAITSDGYGSFTPSTKPLVKVYAHRYAWELTNGPIPDGMTIDHLCCVRHCVNTDHMEVISLTENGYRGAMKRWHGTSWRKDG